MQRKPKYPGKYLTQLLFDFYQKIKTFLETNLILFEITLLIFKIPLLINKIMEI